MDELKEYSEAIKRAGPLSAELDTLLLRLQRQVLWLRHRWRDAPGERYQSLAVSDREADMVASEGHRWKDRAVFFGTNPEAAFLSGLLHEAGQRGEPSALLSLQSLFSLTPCERDILLLAAAVDLVPGLERLYAYVQDDAGLMLPAPSLAMTLLFDSWEEAAHAREAFSPSSPLFAHDLIEWAGPGRGGGLTRPYCITERVLGYLAGSPNPDHRIAAVVRPIRPGRILFAEIWPIEADFLEERIAESLKPDSRERLVVNLVGRDAGVLEGLAAFVCGRLGMPLLGAGLQELEGIGLSGGMAVRLFFREARFRSSAICLRVGQDGQFPARSVLGEAWEYAPLTFVISERPWPAGGMGQAFPCLGRVELCLPPLDHARRILLWEKGLESVSGDGDLSAIARDLANRFQFEADTIASVIERAGQTASDVENPVTRVEASCREVTAPGLDGLAVKTSSSFSWEDIVLPEEALGQLREIAGQFRLRQKVYGEWGFGRKLDRGSGICVLFSGPSGTGKTMAAEILANDLGLNLYRVDLSGVVNKYIGETEKNLRRVFDEGERCQALLFFDEADALFGKRSEVRDSHDRYANIEVNYLLQRMESYRGASILATNMRSAIDTAFMRRLRYVVEFAMPDAPLREAIWRRSFPDEAAVDGIDFRFLARQFTISGGNIKNAVLNAAFLAAADGCPIGMGHVVAAVKREYTKLGRLCVEADFGRYL